MFKKNHPPSPINFENSAHIKLMTYFPKFFAGFWGFKKQVSKNANNCFLRFAENKSFCWYFWKLSVSYTPKFDRQTAFDYTYLDFSCSKLIFFFFLIINIVISGISFFCLSEDTIVSCGPPGARQLWDSSSVYRLYLVLPYWLGSWQVDMTGVGEELDLTYTRCVAFTPRASSNYGMRVVLWPDAFRVDAECTPGDDEDCTWAGCSIA